MGMAAGGFGILMIFLILFYIVILALAVVDYILSALACQTIARRRGIKNPWFAWIPVMNVWQLGCISDQYRYQKTGVDRNLRKKLLWLMIITYICLAPMYMADMFMTMAPEMGMSNEVVGISAILTLILCIPVLVVSIIAGVYQYMAIFDIFRSCDPDKATLFLILSIIFPMLYSIFLFMIRNKDLGLYPQEYQA